jgi:prepilin signal peptidase PulO-like enzyme (type II secretory pathway)
MSTVLAAASVGMLGVLAGCLAMPVLERLRSQPVQLPTRRCWLGFEVATGTLWFLVCLRLTGQGLAWAVPAYLAFAFVCLLLAVVDATTQLLPNRITYLAFPAVLGLLVLTSLGLGEFGRLGHGLLAAAAMGRFVLMLAVISPSGMGAGDVKFALALGWLSWGTIVVGLVSAFLLGGLAGLAAMAVFGLSRRSRLPLRSLAGGWRAVQRRCRHRGHRLVAGVLPRRQVGRFSSRGLPACRSCRPCGSGSRTSTCLA